jgi:hypothetical protein
MSFELSDADPRSDRRSHVFLMAVLRAGTSSLPVRVRNLSARGALLEGSNLPAPAQSVLFRRGSLSTIGSIAWVSGQHCGIHFQERINVDEWVDRAGPVGQQRIDAAIGAYRNGAEARFTVGEPVDGNGRERLVQTSADLFEICERIAKLPGMSVELAEELLKIEAAAQSLQVIGSSRR